MLDADNVKSTEKEQERQKRRIELFRKYSDKINEIEKINKSPSFVMKD